MKHMTSGKLAVLGLFALAGCYHYVSEDVNSGTYDRVQSTPSTAIVHVGDSTAVIVRLVNPFENGAVTSYTVSAVGAGIRVDYDSTYRPVFDSKLDTLVRTTDKTEQRYWVVGVTSGSYTFTLTPTSINTGVSGTVQITVVPSVAGVLSKTTAVAGDTVVITAPTGSVFSQTSAVTFPTGQFAIASRSADSTSITIIAGPGITGAATITNVGVAANPAANLQTLVTSNTLTTPAVTVAPSTVSSATPLIGAPVTVTLGNGLRFLGTTHVFIGSEEAGISSVSADSSTAVIVPLAGSSGVLNYTNIAFSFLSSVPLTLPSDKSITVGSTYGGPTDANAGTFATATTYTLRKSLVISDNGPLSGPCPANLGGGATCRYYKVTVPAGSTQGRIVWNGPTMTDLGVYTLNTAGTSAVTAVADDGGLASGTTGDTSAAFTATAGTIGFVVMNFGPAPTVPWFQWRIVQQ